MEREIIGSSDRSLLGSEREEALRRFPPAEAKRLASMSGLAPQTMHLYGTPARQYIDEMTRLYRSNQKEFYRRKKIVRQAIKERENGKINWMPDFSLTELREIKKEVDMLYG